MDKYFKTQYRNRSADGAEMYKLLFSLDYNNIASDKRWLWTKYSPNEPE